MKSYIGFLVLSFIFSSCGGNNNAEELCRSRLTKNDIINQCKEALQSVCSASELSILRECDEKVARKECIKKLGEVTKKCLNSTDLIKACSYGKERDLLKADFTVTTCINT